jgi:hypothetical protein
MTEREERVPEFQPGDVIDIAFRRAVVKGVYDNGALHVVHSHEELFNFNPAAPDVEVHVVGYDEEYGG